MAGQVIEKMFVFFGLGVGNRSQDAPSHFRICRTVNHVKFEIGIMIFI